MFNSAKLPFMGLIIVQCLIYGIGNPLTKIAYESITPLWFVALRFILAFLCFMAVCGKRVWTVLRRTSVGDYLPACICIALCYIFCNVALQYTTATSAGFFMSVAMLFVPLCAALILHRPYKLIHVPIQLAAAAGMYLLCTGGASVNFGLGEIFALASSLCGGAALVFSEKSLQSMDPFAITAAQIGITAIIACIAALLIEDMSIIPAIQPAAWGVIVYVAIGCSIGGYCLQNIALGHLPAFLVSVLQCATPIFTGIFSALILHESIGFFGIIGGAVLICCILAESMVSAKQEEQVQITQSV